MTKATRQSAQMILPRLEPAFLELRLISPKLTRDHCMAVLASLGSLSFLMAKKPALK